MLEVADLHVAYGDVEAVHGVSVHVATGEVVGIVGPNGAGKSSLLRAICGLVTPTRGHVRFEGDDITGDVPERIVRRGVALVPEGRHIFKTLTVAENLLLGTTVKPDADIEPVLDRFPILRERYHAQADGLSGGEAQQLAIARALLSQPKLLILDEPSFGLAPKMIDFVYELLAELRRSGLTMLLVEQAAARTVAFSDRCVVLASGVQRAAGTREELQRDSSLLDAYLGVQRRTHEAPAK